MQSQSQASEKLTESQQNRGEDYGQRRNTYNRDRDNDSHPRGAGRGNYRGNRPYDPNRGGGERGSYRGNNYRGNNSQNFREQFYQNRAQQDGNFNENNREGESSDAMYSQRPSNYRGNREGYNPNYRNFRGGSRGEYRGGRGEFRGRGNRDGFSTQRGGNGRYSNRPQNRDWEEAKIEEDGFDGDDKDVIELYLNEAELEILERKKTYVKVNLKAIIDEDDIARICHQCNFDESKIDAKLASFSTNKKYEGLEEFEWQTTQTRKEIQADKRKKQEIAERKRIQRERRAEIEEKKAAREIENKRRAEEREQRQRD